MLLHLAIPIPWFSLDFSHSHNCTRRPSPRHSFTRLTQTQPAPFQSDRSILKSLAINPFPLASHHNTINNQTKPNHRQITRERPILPPFALTTAARPHRISPSTAPSSRRLKDNRSTMKSSIAVLGLAIAAGAAAASPDPQVIAKAQPGNLKRQADPALLGYISADGASSCKPLHAHFSHTSPPMQNKPPN